MRNPWTSIVIEPLIPSVVAVTVADPCATPETSPAAFTEATAGSLAKLPKDIRLAIEMATHEESERRAMEGELEILEAAWKRAEEIAGIADSLLMPTEVEEFVTTEKERVASGPKIIVPAGAGVSAPGEGAEPAEDDG